MKSKQKKFLRVYLALSIFFALLSLFEFFVRGSISYVGGLISLKSIGLILGIIGLGSLAYFVISVYALIIFVKNRMHKFTLVIPIIEIATFSISIALAILNIWINTTLIFARIRPINLPIDIFYIAFSIYLLRKFK